MEKLLIAPEFRVTLGNTILTDGMEIECYSSNASHCDWAKLSLHPEVEEQVREIKGEAKVELGYENDYDLLIHGTFQKRGCEIMIKDEIQRLENTFITASFLDCTPQDVLTYVLGIAGIEQIKLSTQYQERKKVFAVTNQNLIDLITNMNTQWRLNYKFYFWDHTFYWGIERHQNEVYVLDENETILSLHKLNHLWQLETIGVPWIHHSQKIEVNHSYFTGETEVEKTIVKVDKDGFTRMYLYFQGE